MNLSRSHVAVISLAIVIVVAIAIGVTSLSKPTNGVNMSDTLQKIHPNITGADWPGYLMDSANSSYNANETTLSTATIPNRLGLVDVVSAGLTSSMTNAIASSVIYANHSYYFGSWNGYFYAIDAATHRILWQINIGVVYGKPQCAPDFAGVTSDPTLVNGVIYFGGSDGNVYAINALDGHIIWKTKISTPPDEFLWGSPVIGNNMVYIGVSSWGDCPLIRGRLDALNQKTGDLLQTHYTVNSNQVGNSIWNKPVLVPSQHLIVIATGNGPFESPENAAIVGLDWNTLKVQWTWQPPIGEINGDYDFGASCIVVPKDINGLPEVLCHNKSAYVYALEVTSGSAYLVWSNRLSFGGQGPTYGEGDISSGVFDGKYVYFSTTEYHAKQILYHSAYYKIDAETGQVIWKVYIPDTFPITSLAGASDFLVTGNVVNNNDTFTGYFYVLSTKDGSILYSQQLSDAVFGSPSIANGEILVPTADGHIYVFGLADMWGRKNALTGNSIAPDWQWQNKHPSDIQFSPTKGLAISPTSSVVGRDNLLFRPAPAGDYSLTTDLSLSAAKAGQMAGLVYYHTDYDSIFVGARTDGHGNVQYIMRMNQQGTTPVSYAIHQTIDQTKPIYLQIVSIASKIYGYASTDGANWTFIGVLSPAFPADYVGITSLHDQGTTSDAHASVIFHALYLMQL